MYRYGLATVSSRLKVNFPHSAEKMTPEVETQAAIHKDSVELMKALAIL